MAPSWIAGHWLPFALPCSSQGGLLAEIFRAVHTIKGTTGFLGFRRLE
jgi:hypothetical protein